MGFYGRFYGGSPVVVEEPEPPGPTPIDAPFSSESPLYIDHVEDAIARLCQQFLPST